MAPTKRKQLKTAGIQRIKGEYTTRTDTVQQNSERLHEIAQDLLPQFGPQWHRHSLVTMKVEALARTLYYNDLYKQIVNVPGVICEFGVQWGAVMSELINLRSIYEPFNVSRTIYGFDTFQGFPSVHKKDGGYSRAGDYVSRSGYEKQLEEILTLQESFAPLNHIKKFELVKGDASRTVDTWLEANPHAIISMLILDMDIYEPTKNVLKKLLPRLTKGSLLVFDELNCDHFPGETRALDEVIGLNNLRLRRTPLQPYCSWAVFGE